VCALASGSSGNCFYVGNRDEGILVDAGISCKQILGRMAIVGLDPEKLKGIFITHEHSDHVRGADVTSRKLGIPVYANLATSKNSFLSSKRELIKIIGKDSKTEIGDLQIEAFSKFHSAADPISYSIYGSKKVSVITDAGHACNDIKEHVSSSDFIFLESNHDENMLEAGSYPAFLKEWIKGFDGHLSNREAGLCILENGSSKMKKIVLSHISKMNNTPELALRTFNSIIKERKNFNPAVSVSIREEPTELFRI